MLNEQRNKLWVIKYQREGDDPTTLTKVAKSMTYDQAQTLVLECENENEDEEYQIDMDVIYDMDYWEVSTAWDTEGNKFDVMVYRSLK